MRVPRRTFLAIAAAAAATMPFASGVGAQERLPAVGRIGAMAAVNSPAWAGFIEAMADLGYVADRDFTIIQRLGDSSRYAELAAEVVARSPDVLIGLGEHAAQFAQATTAIPIVAHISEGRFVELAGRDFARPGGNITGVVDAPEGLVGKRLAALVDAFPDARRIGVVTSSLDPEIEEMAAALGRELVVAELDDMVSLSSALKILERERVDAVYASTVSRGARTQTLIQWAAAERLPVMFNTLDRVEAGGLMSYGLDGGEPGRVMAAYTVRILEGETPAGLPIVTPSPRLTINLKTARATGIEFPPNILALADMVIE